MPQLVQETQSREELFRKRQANKGGSEPPHKDDKQKESLEDGKSDAKHSDPSKSGIWVNRAPVLTLWVAVVAQRQGFSRDSGLSFGKSISGLLAQSKGRRIGVFDEKEKVRFVWP